MSEEKEPCVSPPLSEGVLGSVGERGKPPVGSECVLTQNVSLSSAFSNVPNV